MWNAKDLDYTQDARDWQRIDEVQRRGLLGVTVRFLAGEQAVTDELVPMLAPLTRCAATTGRCSCRRS